MNMTISPNIRSTLKEVYHAKEFLNYVKERFYSTDKLVAGTLMAKLISTKSDESFDGFWNGRG